MFFKVDRWQLSVVIIATITSLISFAYFYDQGLIATFRDGEARLIMARFVIDSTNPGPQHLGGVWPPIPHVFMIPFVANDFLFYSGIAGAIISMIFYVIAALFMYKLCMAAWGDPQAGLVGVLALSGVNLLFMQVTPMSESPFVAFLCMYGYFMFRWVKDVEQLRYLFLAGFAVLLATLTRYEGWALLIVATGTVFFVCVKNKFGYHKTLAHLEFFGVIAVFGVVLWLLWNLIIFGDVLFFTRSEFSAGQIAERTFSGLDTEHQTKGNILFDVKIWGRTCLDILGFIAISISALGFVSFLVSRRKANEKLVGMSLLFPTGFYLVTMFFGFSTVIWHPDYFNGNNWGTRYATLMLPAVGFFSAALVRNWQAWLKVPVIALLVMSSFLTWQAGLLTVHEAKTYPLDPATQTRNQLADWFKGNYDHGLVLMFRVGNERILYSNSFPLSKVVYEGSDPAFWRNSLNNPVDTSIDWVVMWKNLNGEPDEVWENLRGTKVLQDNYSLVYQDQEVEVYKIKEGMDKKSKQGDSAVGK